MNIGEAYKEIKKEFPSISISRIRFLEKEGLIKPKRSNGGTRSFSEKDITRIKNILDLQENQFYSLKAPDFFALFFHLHNSTMFIGNINMYF